MIKRITWLEFSINIETQNFENYIEFMEENILNEQLAIEQYYEEYVKGYPPEAHEEIFEKMFEDKVYDLNNVFPIMLRTSALIAQYSYLEKTLNTISKECKKNYNLTIAPEDIRHNGVKKYIFYLSKVVGLNINENEILWQKIYAYNQIRNRFVHEPDLKYTAKEKTNFEQKIKGLTFKQIPIKPNMFWIENIEKELNTDFLELLTEALLIISEEIKKKNNELEQ